MRAFPARRCTFCRNTRRDDAQPSLTGSENRPVLSHGAPEVILPVPGRKCRLSPGLEDGSWANPSLDLTRPGRLNFPSMR